MSVQKDIIPWKCHICSREFDTPGGGICSRCNHATCRTHLHEIGKKLKLESMWVCDNCLTSEESEGNGRVFHESRIGRTGRRQAVMKVLQAGILYFALVFGAGFVLGPIRVFWAVPRFGVRMAELMEAPFMLAVIIVAARWLVRRLAVPSATPSRLGMGFIALGLLVAAEIILGYLLWGLSITELITSRDPVSGSVYYALLGVFAVMPLLLARK